MKNRKMMLILVILLVIGFASISTTLVINGVIGITTKKDDFNVIFTNAELDGVEKKEFIDETTKQTLTFVTKELTTLNESTTLMYEVTNTSRLYDADVTISCTPIENEYVDLAYIPTTNKMIVEAGKTEIGSITATLKKVSPVAKEIKVSCTLNVNGLEREELGEKITEETPEEITPPVIEGGGDSWSAEDQTISLQTVGTSNSGVKNYEYYISPTIEDPGERVTGTTTGNISISNEGTNYIYFRTVSNSGKKSSWSNYIVTKIDKSIPTINMVAAGTYEMSDDRELATSTFGEGGGETTCTNVAYGGSFTKMSGIKAFGNQTIRCTATGNNGKSVSQTVTYTIYAFFNGSSMYCDYYGSGSCTRNGTSLTIPRNYIQYGPYRKAAKGCYKVTYEGSGFVTNALYQAYQDKPTIRYTLLSKSVTSTKVTYYFNITADLTGTGLEIVINNRSSGSITVKSIKVEPVSTCPAS